jgi:hypothetical protein
MPREAFSNEAARREAREQKKERKAALRQARRERKSNRELPTTTFEKGSP